MSRGRIVKQPLVGFGDRGRRGGGKSSGDSGKESGESVVKAGF